jgi:Uncharacterised protein family UPF0547
VSPEEGSSGQQEPQAGATIDQRPAKTCPDCAELVLAAARKCRYCGYRFDHPLVPQGSASNLMGMLYRPQERVTLSGTLAQLGVELGRDEQPAQMWLGRVQGSDGYVVLTDRRLLFVKGLRRSSGASRLLQNSLNELAGVEVLSHRRKQILLIHWGRSGTMSIDGLSPEGLRQLRSALLVRIDASPTTGP